MVVLFASFMLNDQRVVNLFGFGLAMAMYAAVAMFVLVPAVLSIVGRPAWWPRAPSRGCFLARIPSPSRPRASLAAMRHSPCLPS